MATMTTKISEMITDLLNSIKIAAQVRTDGNTVALMDRILRDVNNLQPEYASLTLEDIYARAQEDAQANDAADPDNGGTGPSFLPQSYEKTGAEDVNQKPLPPTGEENSAPFLSKADMKVNKDTGNVQYDTSDDKKGVTDAAKASEADESQFSQRASGKTPKTPSAAR